MTEEELCRELLATEGRLGDLRAGELKPVTAYADLARHESWQQLWDAEARAMGELREVSGAIWSDAIERCLGDNGSAYIPKADEPYYIDRPIVLKSGDRLVAHPDAEIRLKIAAAGTCMVRNSKVAFSQDGPVEMCAGADEGVLIEGGVWSDQNDEGRGRGGAYDQQGSMPGSRGVFFLHNISRVVVRNVRFRDCSPFAIQIGNATDFLIENIACDETADGVHVEGPSARGIIRRVAGKTNDDSVALNAWDWDNSSITFGPITDMLVEDVEVKPGYTWAELRLLPGTKVFPSGETVDCDIRRCVFRNIRGVHTFKMYDQPNISKPELDYADPIGRMSDLFFSDIVVDGIAKNDYYDTSSDGVFDICADIEGISIRNVRFNYVPGRSDMAPYLVSVGPKAVTWSKAGRWPETVTWPEERPEDAWTEVFNPNANPVVKGLSIKDVYLPDPERRGSYVPCDDPAKLVNERKTTPNPDFPNTAPRGGNGCGSIVDPVFG